MLHPRLVVLAVALAACTDPSPVPDAPPDRPLETVSRSPVIGLPDSLIAALVAEDPLWEDALRIHYDALVIDGHVDTPWRMIDDGLDIRQRNADHHLDVPRMAEGGLDAVFFALFVSRTYGESPDATDRALELLREVERQLEGLDAAEIARTAADVTRIADEGRHAILIGLEGGHALQASPEVLRELADRGVRYVTLNHTNTNSWSDSSQDEALHDGLTDVGRQLVAEMNRLGVLVDLSHSADAVVSDVFDVTRAPVIFSHSSCRALVENIRNVTDAQLRQLDRNDGLVMINVYSPLVNSHLTPEVMAGAYARIEADGGDLAGLWTAVEAERQARGLGNATLSNVLDHIDHAVQVAGIDHVGLGTDFDGIPLTPDGLDDVTRLPWITHGLLARGYTEEDVRKILGGNALRVLRIAEEIGERLRADA
ncbi:MAG: dipeptidase [Bacteroidota bacterium]